MASLAMRGFPHSHSSAWYPWINEISVRNGKVLSRQRPPANVLPGGAVPELDVPGLHSRRAYINTKRRTSTASILMATTSRLDHQWNILLECGGNTRIGLYRLSLGVELEAFSGETSFELLADPGWLRLDRWHRHIRSFISSREASPLNASATRPSDTGVHRRVISPFETEMFRTLWLPAKLAALIPVGARLSA